MKINRDRWYGNVEQELNRQTAILLADGKITQAQHDAILAENHKQRHLPENNCTHGKTADENCDVCRWAVEQWEWEQQAFNRTND